MRKEEFEKTAYKMSYEQHRTCYCPDCERKDCIHRECYRRMPVIDGGLGLCPNLQFAPILGEMGVLVERNGKIKDYRTKVHAVRTLIAEGCDENEVMEKMRKQKVYYVFE